MEIQELEKLVGAPLYEALCQEYPGNMISVLCALAREQKKLDDEMWDIIERLSRIEGQINQWR